MQKLKHSQLHFSSRLPSRLFWRDQLKLDSAATVIFYDQRIEKNPLIKQLKSTFQFLLPVTAGESLKSLKSFESILSQLSRIEDLSTNVRQLTFVSVGGGTVGDTIGFLASVYKRGVRWVNVPSTWLSAIDSGHGGKTALNVANIKNQVGTFYMPSDVVLSSVLLKTQGSSLAKSAIGEVAKTILLKPLRFKRALASKRKWSANSTWENLPALIKVKTDIVKADPHEQLELRRHLNWGHTFGHVFEAFYRWDHGKSVAQGLLYELLLAKELKLLKLSSYQKIIKILNKQFGIEPLDSPKIPQTTFNKIIKQDKKAQSSTEINVVMAVGIGRFKIRPVSIDRLYEIYHEGNF